MGCCLPCFRLSPIEEHVTNWERILESIKTEGKGIESYTHKQEKYRIGSSLATLNLHKEALGELVRQLTLINERLKKSLFGLDTYECYMSTSQAAGFLATGAGVAAKLTENTEPQLGKAKQLNWPSFALVASGLALSGLSTLLKDFCAPRINLIKRINGILKSTEATIQLIDNLAQVYEDCKHDRIDSPPSDRDEEKKNPVGSPVNRSPLALPVSPIPTRTPRSQVSKRERSYSQEVGEREKQPLVNPYATTISITMMGGGHASPMSPLALSPPTQERQTPSPARTIQLPPPCMQPEHIPEQGESSPESYVEAGLVQQPTTKEEP